MSYIVVNSKLCEEDGTACLVAYRIVELIEEMKVGKLIVIGALHFKPIEVKLETMVHILHLNRLTRCSDEFEKLNAPLLPEETPIRDSFLMSMSNFLQASNVPTELLIIRGHRLNRDDDGKKVIFAIWEALQLELGEELRKSVTLDEITLDSLVSLGWKQRVDGNMSMFG